MGSNSEIEWTDATWTPIRARVKQDAVEIARAKGWASFLGNRTAYVKGAGFGGSTKKCELPILQPGKVGPHCERVSPGCENCYSETNNGRCLPHNGTGLPFDRRARDLVDIFLDEKILTQPLKWRTPKKVFVCSQTDLFGEWVPDLFITRVFAVMAMCHMHTFQVLTKRPDRMLAYLSDDANEMSANMEEDRLFQQRLNVGTMGHSWPLPNVWLGVSVENQEQADKRIPLLLQTPAAVRWISAEPLLGPIDLDSESAEGLHALGCGEDNCSCGDRGVDWCVCGGESGPGARPMHPDWVRSLRDQCKAAGVPFLFKQWGEWASTGPLSAKQNYVCTKGRSGPFSALEIAERCRDHNADCGKQLMYAVGKKATGRLLDGREWNEYPR